MKRERILSITLIAPFGLMTACSGDLSGDGDDVDDAADATSAEGGSGDELGDTGETDAGEDGDEPGDNPSCAYTSPFTSQPECRDYLGSAWTEADVSADCSGVSGSLDLEQGCATAGALGVCVLDGGTEWEVETVIYGSDAGLCETQALGCETFGGGVWQPAEICEGSGETGGDSGGDEDVFIQPYLDCREPLEGEPEGQSEGGQVCTWQAVSASTEEGRRFVDYGDCEVIYSQRPYYAVATAPIPEEPDPRLDDPEYMAELDWVREQIEASACACCHSTEVAPNGTSNWYVEAPNNWMNSFYDTGLALGAGWVDSTSFGAYDPEDNNGFDRINSGIPSTDPERMVAFFMAELEYRGLGAEDFVDAEAFGGPLYQQLIYEPEACANGEGVGVDGTITWTGGTARYIYVLEAESGNPTVPPNLDLPDGTLWRVDVPWQDGEPVASGELVYGELPAGLSQRYPADDAPTGLVPGQTYYLYVTKDVGVPLTRCLFEY